MQVVKFASLFVGATLIGKLLTGCATAPPDQAELVSVHSVYVTPVSEPQITTMSVGGRVDLQGASLGEVLMNGGVHLGTDTHDAVTDAFQSDGYNIAASPDYADALVQVKITTAQYFIQPTIAGGGCTPYAQFDVTMKSKAGKTLLDRTYRLQSGGGVGMTGHVLLPSDPKYDLADCNQISTQPQVPVAAFRAALALLKSAIAADVKKAS